MSENNETWHLNAKIEVRSNKLGLVVIIIVPFITFKFWKKKKKLISQGALLNLLFIKTEFIYIYSF